MATGGPMSLAPIDALAQGALTAGAAGKQTQQFKAASGLRGQALSEFAAKIKIIGLAGSLVGCNALKK